MSANTCYALRVVRVEGVANHSALYVEVEFNGIKRKTGSLNSEGRPVHSDTLVFSRSTGGAGSLNVCLVRSSDIICRVTVEAEKLLRESGETDVRRQLHMHSQEESSLIHRLRSMMKRKKKGSRLCGEIILCLSSVDDQARARIEICTAEQRVTHIQTLVDRTERREETIGTVIEVADKIVGIIDNVAQIHPLFNVSWQAASALYKLVTHQLRTDAALVGMVEQMRKTLDFSNEVNNLDDHSQLLRPVLKDLLMEITDCAQFVQDYAKRDFSARICETDGAQKIKAISGRFTSLRNELDSIIGLNTSKEVQYLGLQQQLKELRERLQPRQSDPSRLTSRPRCLAGTRKEYLDPIMEFFSSENPPNVFWLTGAAGSGKSTIAMTAFDKNEAEKRPVTYTFFEREKSEPSSVIRTIACTLATHHPTYTRYISESASQNICNGTLEKQFEELLLEPLRAVATGVVGPVVLILDAIDECGTAAERGDLLELLTTHFAKLPSKVRILITSRPEEDVMEGLRCGSGIRHEELRHDSKDSRRDVDRYIHQEMAKTLGRPEPKEEARDAEIEMLCKAADGLFIWAATAVKMVQNEVFKEKVLKSLVEDAQLVGGYGLDRLYDTALKESRLWEPRSRDEASAVMGLVLFAKEALDVSSISAFLGLDKNTVDAILSRLRSVVSHEPGNPIRLHHASFADYLLSPQRSPGKPWHIDETEQKQAMTERCFDIMATNLRFNICSIESSFIPNSKVPSLKERIGKFIPPHLSYACRFWSMHMCELENADNLTMVRRKLRDFANARLLYWLEVLSLTDCFTRIAGRALNDASSWIESADPEIWSFLWSAYKLVSVFAYAISQSAPHVYLSAMSLWSDESPVAQHYSKMYPVVKVHRQGKKTPDPCIRVLKGRGEPVRSVAISSDGRCVAFSSDDKVIRVWDIDSGELSPSSFEMGEPGTVAFSRDDKYIVSCSRKGTVYAWNVGNGKVVSDLKLADVDGAASHVACTRDGKRVVCICNWKIYIPVFDNGSLELVPGWFKDVDDVEFRAVSLNGKYVAGTEKERIAQERIALWDTDTEKERIALWDTDTGKRVSDWFGEAGWSYAVTCDGKRVVSDNKIWNADSGDFVAEIKGIRVASASFSSGGKRVVVGSFGGEIAIWDVEGGQIIWGPVQGHTRGVTSVIFTPDGKRVISGSADDTIRVWGADSRKSDSGSSDAHTNSVSSVAFSPDGKRVVSGSDDIRVWDPETGKLLSGPFKHEDYVTSVAFSPDSKHVVSGTWVTIRIWDVDSGNQVLSLDGHENWVRSVAYSSDGKHIVSGSGDETICIWDAVSGELTKGPLKAHTRWVLSVSFSPDNNRVVSGSNDKTICIWDADTGNLVKGPLEGHSDAVYSVSFSPNGQRVASGSEDGTIRIWDADTGDLVSLPFKGHMSGILSVSYSPDGKRIASGSKDKTVRIWNVDSGELALDPLEGHTSDVHSVSFSPDGERVVSGSYDKTIRVWDVSGVRTPLVCNEGNAKGDATSSLSHHTAATSRAQGTDPDPRRAQSISNWKLYHDGWIKGEGGELLAWIPQDTRTTLWTPRTAMIFSCDFSTKLDFLNSPVGENWAEGYPKQN